MTCREFEHRATSLTLWELSQAQDQQILDHAGECQKCAAWLQQQRMLAATMQTLQARTADCAAGPDVERALLRAFRQGTSEPLQPEMAHRFHSNRDAAQPILRSWGVCGRRGSHRGGTFPGGAAFGAALHKCAGEEPSGTAKRQCAKRRCRQLSSLSRTRSYPRCREATLIGLQHGAFSLQASRVRIRLSHRRRQHGRRLCCADVLRSAELLQRCPGRANGTSESWNGRFGRRAGCSDADCRCRCRL